MCTSMMVAVTTAMMETVTMAHKHDSDDDEQNDDDGHANDTSDVDDKDKQTTHDTVNDADYLCESHLIAVRPRLVDSSSCRSSHSLSLLSSPPP